MEKKELVYFVDRLDSAFVLNDIRQFVENGYILRLFLTGPVTAGIEIPGNVVIHSQYIKWENFKPGRLLLRHLWVCLTAYSRECLVLSKLLPFRKAMATLTSNIFKANEIQRLFRENQEKSFPLTFYSFWFYDCIFLAWLKKRGACAKAVTRAHGGDLFEERSSLQGKVLFRNFQLAHIDHVFSVSVIGTQYLQSRYRSFRHKISTSYLGSVYHDSRSPLPEDNFVIVSCARIRNVKRIHLIAEFLLAVKFQITWYHIGDENLDNTTDATISLYKKAKLALETSGNVVYHPLGALSNEEVYRFYASTPISLFISLSESEGIPVSIMEAISFGIPVLATDVGGCREIVNEQTGLLVSPHIVAEEFGEMLRRFREGKGNSLAGRDLARKYWENNFNIEKNYRTFLDANLAS